MWHLSLSGLAAQENQPDSEVQWPSSFNSEWAICSRRRFVQVLLLFASQAAFVPPATAYHYGRRVFRMSHHKPLSIPHSWPLMSTINSKARYPSDALPRLQEQARNSPRASKEHTRYPKGLSSEEERIYGRAVQKCKQWREKRRALKHELGHEPTTDEWARACGFRSATDFQDALSLCESAREIFITSNMALVYFIVPDLESHFYFSIKDMLRIGMGALVRAVDNFDPTRGLKFSSYAYPTIRGTVLSATSKLQPIGLPHNLATDISKMKRLQREMSEEEEESRRPLASEYSNLLGFSEKRLRKLTIAKANAQAPFPAELAEDELLMEPSITYDFKTMMEHISQKESIEKALKTCTEEEQAIVIMRSGLNEHVLSKGKSWGYLSRRMNMSTYFVRKYCIQAVEKVARQAFDCDNLTALEPR
mmetsp:Transcript_39006/g.71596  ORF Transcript_39006/g.71596 Transcript_39006/m.71596 type:complete len:421 (-) Transcript_39006:13-1275(-)